MKSNDITEVFTAADWSAVAYRQWRVLTRPGTQAVTRSASVTTYNHPQPQITTHNLYLL